MSPLFFLILIPLIAAAFVIAGSNARITSLIASIVNLVFCIILFAFYDPKGDVYQFYSTTPIIPGLGISLTLGADGLSLIMLFLTAVVTLAAIAVARPPKKNANWFYASLLLISAAGIGAFASVDLLFFYMFHELALIPAFLLIGIWGSGDRQAAAWKATIYLALGSFVLLLGLVGLYLIQPEGMRSFDLQQIIALAHGGLIAKAPWVYLLLLVGFGVLVSLFPFHTWAPQAYASAPPPAAMLHAGVLKKFGLYGLLRIAAPILPEEVKQFSNILLILLAANILYVGYVTISQRKLDWMLGYSSVMHMGYIFLGFAALTKISLTGAAFMLFAHGLSISTLFALSGEIRERTGTLDFTELGGLARTMPALGLSFGFAAMAAIGLPGFVGFPGELMIFFGSFAAGTSSMIGKFKDATFSLSSFQIATICAVWGVVISAVYMLRAYRRIFWGPLNNRWSELHDLSGERRTTVVSLIAIMLIFGFFPQLLVKLLAPVLIWP